ncbi:MAG: hypothetical protein ACK43M_13010, partial [Allorhizobium sp.]
SADSLNQNPPDLQSPADSLSQGTALEMMVGLVFAHHRVKRAADTGIWFWMPLGRFMWRNRNGGLEAKIRSLEADKPDAPVYTSGMLGGSATAAAPTFANVREFLNKAGTQFW